MADVAEVPRRMVVIDMIVDPDFLTHWKTQALIEALSDPTAPIYVLALWSHCQQRRTDRFEGISFATFAGICRYPHKDKAGAFFESMKECGFVETDGEAIVAHGWLEANATLIGRWKGGQTTQSKWLDKAKPIAEQEVSPGEKRRVEKSREDKKKGGNKSRSAPVDDEEWRRGLGEDIAYRHINIPAEFSKWQRWCIRNRRQPTQARFEAWLNRIEPPVTAFSGTRTVKPPKVLPDPPPELTDEQIAKNKAFIAETMGKLTGRMNVKEAI